jgi:hypothetical protein
MNNQLDKHYGGGQPQMNKKDLLNKGSENVSDDEEENEDMYQSFKLIKEIEVEDEEVDEMDMSDDDKPVWFPNEDLDENSVKELKVKKPTNLKELEEEIKEIKEEAKKIEEKKERAEV